MNRRKWLLLAIIALFITLACLPAGAESPKTSLRQVSAYQGAKLYKAGKFNVLVLKGNYRQMGRQYGRLMKKDLGDMYNLAIEGKFINDQHFTYEMLKRITADFYQNYPARIQAIVEGMAETSGLEKEKLVMLAQVVTLVGYTKTGIHCSAIAAWADYTAGGPLVFGRNFDYPLYFKEFARFMTVVVYNPDDGSVPVAQIGYAGQMDTLTAMNRAGIFTEINDGAVSGGYDLMNNKLAITIMPFTFLLDSSTIEQLDSAIRTTKADYAILYNVADKTAAYSYEWSVNDVHRRDGDDKGLLVATNHFVDPAWKSPEPEGDPYDTIARRKNLLALGRMYKGRFNAQAMMEILDIPYDKGGVTRDWAIYQVVAMPQGLDFWLKAPGYQDWTHIELGKLF